MSSRNHSSLKRFSVSRNANDKVIRLDVFPLRNPKLSLTISTFLEQDGQDKQDKQDRERFG